jgi:uncharacterized protein YdeI (BOF family)
VKKLTFAIIVGLLSSTSAFAQDDQLLYWGLNQLTKPMEKRQMYQNSQQEYQRPKPTCKTVRYWDRQKEDFVVALVCDDE